VKELKEWLRAAKIDFSDCVEKKEFICLVKANLDNAQPTSSNSNLWFEVRPVGPLQCNMAIIADKTTKHAVLVDPGGDPEVILDLIKTMQVTIDQILVTHAHFDHCLAANRIKEATKAPICINKADEGLWSMLSVQCMMYGVQQPADSFPTPDQWLNDGDKLKILNGRCIHTPGHSPGSMCFYFSSENLLCSGDTLFKSTIGRTDLVGGDPEAIKKSIFQKLFTLPEITKVIPGHGKWTNIRDEKKDNLLVKMKGSL